MFDKGNRAFVSFIQAYRKHDCNLIFRIKDLNYGSVAKGFGLLRMPRMPELKNVKVVDFKPAEVDIAKIPYKDKQREQDRQKKLKIHQETGQWPSKHKAPVKKNISWSIAKEQRTDKKLNRKERQLKKKRKKCMEERDLEELNEDIRLIKKLKKGKITKSDFNDEFVGSDSGDDNTVQK